MTLTPRSYTLPSIHLNGTGKATLKEETHRAYRSVCDTLDVFCDITCNARDYYPQGPDAYTRARQERDEALEHFGAIKQYLEAHLLHLSS